MICCTNCGDLVDTDDDPDSLYVPRWPCLCQHCRDKLDLPPVFDLKERTQ